jgi:predicted ATP-dependent Lon-type protease
MLEFSKETTNRDEKAIVKSTCGFLKLLYPDGIYDRDTIQEVVNMSVELRQYILDERFELYRNRDDIRKLEAKFIV